MSHKKEIKKLNQRDLNEGKLSTKLHLLSKRQWRS